MSYSYLLPYLFLFVVLNLGCRGNGSRTGIESSPGLYEKDTIGSPHNLRNESNRKAFQTETKAQRDKNVSAPNHKGNKRRDRDTIEILEPACTSGNGTACFRLGVKYRDGKGVKANEHLAKSWFQLACQAGSTSGCDALGH